jgi:hypothetical protein
MRRFRQVVGSNDKSASGASSLHRDAGRNGSSGAQEREAVDSNFATCAKLGHPRFRAVNRWEAMQYALRAAQAHLNRMPAGRDLGRNIRSSRPNLGIQSYFIPWFIHVSACFA